MDTGRNILSDDKAKVLREIIEQQEGAEKITVTPVRGSSKTGEALWAALERAEKQAQQIKERLSEIWLTPSREELLEGVRLCKTHTTEGGKAGMTIDEAIQHCKEESGKNRDRGCAECAAEHDQLADWLEELKQRRGEAMNLRRMAFDAERRSRTEAIVQDSKATESTRREAELARKRAPIIAVDFDGTLCENKWPCIGETKWETVQALVAAQAAGARLILWTNRVGARLEEAVEWARNRELEFDAVNENLPEIKAAFTTDCRKVYADIYLDDRAAQPSAAVLEQLWETARATMNEAAKEQPQACNPAHRGAVTAEQFEAIWNDNDGEEEQV